jgi:site-specific recombinase XerD
MSPEYTFPDIDIYLAVHPFSEDTRINYGTHLRFFLKWCAKEGIELNDITPLVFLRYIAENGWEEGGAMQRIAFYAIRSYLRWKLGIDQPLDGLRIRRKAVGPQRTLSAEERDLIFITLQEKAHNAPLVAQQESAVRDLALVSLAIDTGLRASELCEILMSGLDMMENRVCVEGKYGVWRDPVFSEATHERISNWLKVREIIVKPGEEHLFVGITGRTPGRGLTRVGLRLIMIRISRESGVKHFSPMALRRSMATLSIRNGAPTRIVQVQGGWAKLESVERYTQTIKPKDIAPFFATGSCHPQKTRMEEE